MKLVLLMFKSFKKSHCNVLKDTFQYVNIRIFMMIMLIQILKAFHSKSVSLKM